MFKNVLTAIAVGLAVVAEATAGSITYTYANNEFGNWGTGKKETYDVAIRIDNPVLAGKKITAINASVYAIDGISKTSVWLSKELNLKNRVNAPDIVSVPATPNSYGEMKVTLDTPYTLTEDGVYVGYSLTVDELNDDTYNPLLFSTATNENGLYLHSSRTALKWMNYGVERLPASAVIEVTIEGDFPEYSLDIVSMPTVYGKAGATGSAQLEVMNYGVNTVNEISYTYTIGETTKTGNVSLSTPVKTDFIYSAQALLTFDVPEEIGEHNIDVTIDKINGNENIADTKSASAKLYTVSDIPRHRAVMEEFTGTWCGWCTRGWFALEKMNSLYGSDFIGLAYHSGDPMQTIDDYDFPVYVDGFPSASIDRGAIIDPYYGTAKDGFGIENDWLNACKVFSPASISLYAWWADADKTTIDVTSFTKFVIEENDADYRLSYVLCANDLHSAESAWDQSNYFPNYASDYAGSELYELCEMPSSINDLHFNEVVLIANDPKGIAGSLPESTKINESNEDSYTFTITEDVAPLIQNPANLFVVAMVIDGKTGKIVNAIKAPVTAEAGIDTVKRQGSVEEVAVRYTDLQGRTINTLRPGIYVKTVKYSDGTVKSEKTIVR